MKPRVARKILLVLMVSAFIVSACGNASNAVQEDSIATAVAMTVAVRETGQAAIPTSTPEAVLTPTLVQPTATQPFAPPTAPPPRSDQKQCLFASLVSETIPDGTIMKPGEFFWKSWVLRNDGECAWDATYKIIYWDGDQMGGLVEYPFTNFIRPGEQATITIQLKAPETNGSYKGFWKMQGPPGHFGVGQYDTPFWVQIQVNDSDSPQYGVTSVTYNIVRNPVTGCATNTRYNIYATITTNGPAEVWYRWLQSDGNNMKQAKKLVFTEASSLTLPPREWTFHMANTPGTKWMQIIIDAPNYLEAEKATWYWSYDCP